MPIFRDFLSALRLVVRARFLGMAGAVLLVASLASFLSAYFSGRQPATVAMDVGFSTIRLLLPLLIVLLVQELFSKEFDRRYYLSSLSYPRARLSLFLGRFVMIMAVVWGTLLFFGFLQVWLVSLVGGGYVQATPVAVGFPYAVTISFIGVDLFVLAALASFLSVFASAPSFVLIGTLGFMLVARSYSAVMELLNRDASLVIGVENYRSGLGVLGYIIPDLGALDMRMLALYGRFEFLPHDWLWLLLGSISYAFGLLGLALWSLQRKRFS